MPIESLCRTFYLMSIVTFALYVHICEILAAEICMILTITVTIDQGQMKCQSKANVASLIFNANDDVVPICYRLKYIFSRNLLELDRNF